MNIHDFDAIRPLLPEEIPAAIEALFAEPQFCSILQSFYKDIPLEILKAKALSCPSLLDLQNHSSIHS